MEAVCAFCDTITAIVANPIIDPKIATRAPIPPLAPELSAILSPHFLNRAEPKRDARGVS
jgi:hypothetical protein